MFVWGKLGCKIVLLRGSKFRRCAFSWRLFVQQANVLLFAGLLGRSAGQKKALLDIF